MADLALDQVFPDLKAARLAITAYCASMGKDWRCAKADTTRLRAICGRDKTCPFQVLVSYKTRTGTYSISTLISTHSCIGAAVRKREAAVSLPYLISRIENKLPISHSTTGRQVRDWFKQNEGLDIADHQAWKVKRSLVGDALSEQAAEFFQLPDYAERILESDPGAFVKFQYLPNGSFHSFFVCPTPAQTVWQNSRGFIALDAAFTKTAFEYVLMLAAGYDGADNLVIYAWAIVPSETYATWAWFCELLDRALGSVNHSNTTVISDRQKGLTGAIASVLPDAAEGFCVKHIAANAVTRFGQAIESHIWSCARAATHADYVAALDAIDSAFKPEARVYVAGIAPERWVDYAFVGNRLGRYTSNIVEIANAQYREMRELPVIQLLKAIWDDQLVKFGARAEALWTTRHSLPDSVATLLTNSELQAGYYAAKVSQYHPIIVAEVVRIGKTSDTARFVQLWPEHGISSYSCHQPRHTGTPCAHVVAVCRTRRLAPGDFVIDRVRNATIRDSYAVPYMHVDTTGLVELPDAGLPAPKVARGRKQKKRRERGAAATSVGRKCGRCGTEGHDKRKCPVA